MTTSSRRFITLKTLSILLLAGAALGHAQDQKQLEPAVQGAVNLLANWGEKVNTPGTKGELVEVKRGQQDGKLMVVYEFYVRGAPKSQSYALFQGGITQRKDQVALPEVFLGDDGKVCITNKKDCPVPLQLGFIPGKGEPFRFLLVSKDAKYSIALLAVPDPITGSDHGCSVEVIRVTPKFEAALIRGKGFKSDAQIKYTSNSAGEVIEGKFTADGEGSFVLVLAPFVKGKDTGVDNVVFESTGCAPRVSYQWGTTED